MPRVGSRNSGSVEVAATPRENLPNFTITQEQLELLVRGNLDIGGGKGTQLTADRDVKYHPHPWINVPEGMSMEQLQRVAKKKAEELNTVHEFNRTFAYRPDDGAYAAMNVIHRMFGMTVGTATKTIFGDIPPQFRTIHVAHNLTAEVPHGKVELAALPGAIVNFGATRNKSGLVFHLSVESPKKHADKIEAFFNAVDDELRLSSIYRGKALEIESDGSIKFLDVHEFNPNQIVFSNDVNRHLDAGVFGLIRYTDASRRANLPMKRAVLTYGPFGTGKTSLGMMAAQECLEYAWTFIKVNAGNIEALRQAVTTAALYGQTTLFIEDIDRYTPKATDTDAMSELLDIFDGVGAKNAKLLMVMTTNHVERIPAGMLRPGRLDDLIEIAGLDRDGTEKLIRAAIPAPMLEDNIDFDAIYKIMKGWEPAWIKGAASRATEFGIARSAGDIVFKLDTIDLVDSANSYAKQLDLMKTALEGEPVNMLDETLGDLVTSAVRKGVTGTGIVDSDGDKMWELKHEAA